MKDVLADDLNQASNGWKHHQKKMEQIAKEHMQSFPWANLEYDDIDESEFESLHMCGGKGLK